MIVVLLVGIVIGFFLRGAMATGSSTVNHYYAPPPAPTIDDTPPWLRNVRARNN